jgi:hypothetical protein
MEDVVLLRDLTDAYGARLGKNELRASLRQIGKSDT